ncbi:DUF4336 domain-containing protein [Collimonas sp.]|jgi:hypothetical protein|uniref:DUF4336 domain-containing protein n=1 Tax=Collimonas sp. TaxID=1963772 RepID=UPI002CB943D2|nr:DUF4336 domain-containing protein [Collimonas sp.]HWW04047.1 DUF4336 domain-containing protein [Collimonas sp.]
MLQTVAPDIWHAQHSFVATGLRVSSRMTVVRLQNSGLWLHSPVPLTPTIHSQLAALGDVRFIVAPSKTHHLFVGEYLDAFPQAKLYGAPGLLAKRPDLHGLRELTPEVEPEWREDFEQIFFAGIPLGNETVWFHKSSRTLIVTDLCQWWCGDLSFAAKLYAGLSGVRTGLAVPRTIRLLVKDRQAARASARKILGWPFERVVMAHDSIVEQGAHRAVEKAFAYFDK